MQTQENSHSGLETSVHIIFSVSFPRNSKILPVTVKYLPSSQKIRTSADLHIIRNGDDANDQKILLTNKNLNIFYEFGHIIASFRFL